MPRIDRGKHPLRRYIVLSFPAPRRPKAWGIRSIALALVGVAAVSAALSAARPAHAEDAPVTDTIGVSAAPLSPEGTSPRSRFSYQMSPGQTIDDTYVVTNVGSTPRPTPSSPPTRSTPTRAATVCSRPGWPPRTPAPGSTSGDSRASRSPSSREPRPRCPSTSSSRPTRLRATTPPVWWSPPSPTTARCWWIVAWARACTCASPATCSRSCRSTGCPRRTRRA